jgi:hypothetical protein
MCLIVVMSLFQKLSHKQVLAFHHRSSNFSGRTSATKEGWIGSSFRLSGDFTTPEVLRSLCSSKRYLSFRCSG